MMVLCLSLENGLGAQATTTAQSQLDELSARAAEAQRRDDYQQAAKVYQEILKLRPDLTGARLNLGLMQFSLKDYSAAIQTFEAVLHQNPKVLPANLFLGLSLLRLQRPREAVAYLTRAQSLDPRNEKTLVALGQANSILRDYGQANNWYSDAAQVNPQSADAWYGLGVSYLALSREAAQQLARTGAASPYSQLLIAESLEQQSRGEDAIKLYERLATTAPRHPCFRAAVGLGLARLGEIDSAEQLFQSELKNSPGCLPARLGVARVAIEHGDLAGAMRSFDELWALDSHFVESSAASSLAGLAPEKVNALRARLGKWIDGENKEAREVLTAALAGEPSEQDFAGAVQATASLKFSAGSPASPRHLFSEGRYSLCTQALRPNLEKLYSADLLILARCAFHSGDYRTAFLASGRAVKLDPENFESSYWRIRTAEKLASNSLLHTSVLNPNSARVHILLGDAYREGEHFREAEEEYRRAIQISPHGFAGHFGLAATYYQNFKIDQAAEKLKEALDLKSDDPDASFLMGSILVLRRQYDRARPYLLKGLQGNPNNVPHVYALFGKIDAAQGRLKEARVELEKSLEADNDGSYHYQLSRVYTQLGNKQAAAAALAQSEAIRKASAQRAVRRLGLLPPSTSDQ